MSNRDITLPEDVRALADELAENRGYPNAAEFLADAVRFVAEEDKADIEALRALVRESLDDPRPSRSAEEVRAALLGGGKPAG